MRSFGLEVKVTEILFLLMTCVLAVTSMLSCYVDVFPLIAVISAFLPRAIFDTDLAGK